MTDPSPAAETPAPAPKAEREGFGFKHIASLLFAAVVTILIFVFQEQLRDLDKLAYAGGFLAMLIGNATVILPVPGLIFVFALGGTLNPLLVGLTAGPGAALGELTGYAAGYGGSAAIDNFAIYHRIRGWMERYGLAVIAVLAAIPNPVFDMAGIVAGSLRVKWWQFLIAAWIGKTLQALFIAYAGALSLGWVEKYLVH
jgi:uncharacterized membrane protein YdjX (TVP38/TMEM64 family)